MQDIYQRGLDAERKKFARKMESERKKHLSELNSVVSGYDIKISDRDKHIKVISLMNSITSFLSIQMYIQLVLFICFRN